MSNFSLYFFSSACSCSIGAGLCALIVGVVALWSVADTEPEGGAAVNLTAGEDFLIATGVGVLPLVSSFLDWDRYVNTQI